MANISVTEADFEALAAAANFAKDRGDMDYAHRLDRLARKANAALCTNNSSRRITRMMGVSVPPLSWRDMPSTLMD